MTTAYAADVALAAAAPPGAAGSTAMLTQFVFIAAFLAIIYFLLIRPQQTQRRDRDLMLGALKKGDRVVTTSGLHGTVTGLDDNTVILRVTDQVKLQFDKTAIGRVVAATGERDA